MRLAPNVPLASLTTLRLGGPARELAVLEDPSDFPELIASASRTGSVPRVIGSGSNVLAADDGYPSLVARMAATGVRLDRSHDGERVLVTVQAGHELDALVNEVVAEGLSGIECLTGIPGTVELPRSRTSAPTARRTWTPWSVSAPGTGPPARKPRCSPPNASSATALASSSTPTAGPSSPSPLLSHPASSGLRSPTARWPRRRESV